MMTCMPKQAGFNFCIAVAVLLYGGAVEPAMASGRDGAALTLDEALRLADERNLQLRGVRQERMVARGQVDEVRSTALPRLEVSAQYVRLDEAASIQVGDLTFPMGREDLYEGVAEVRQVLYAGGGILAALRLAHSFEDAVEAQMETVRRRIVFAVHDAFNRVLLAGEQYKAAEEALVLSERNLADVKARQKQGLATEFDGLRAGAQVSRTQAGRIAAQNDLRMARLALFRLLDLPLDSSRPVEGSLHADPPAGDAGDMLPGALARRPDMAAARREVEVRREAVRVARSGRRPKVVAFGQYQQTNPDRYHENAWEDAWRVGVRAVLPIFDGRETSGKIAQAQAHLSQAELHIDDTRARVALELAEASANLATAGGLVEAHARHVREAEEALRLAERAYEEGISRQLDVISAQVALTDSRREYAAAQYKQVMALRALELASGTLSPIMDAGPPSHPLQTGGADRSATLTSGE